MASCLDFVEFVTEQIKGSGNVRYQKMFGEYMIYCNNKPIILICDDTGYVKILPETTEFFMNNAEKGFPYKGAKEHYVVSIIEDREKMEELAKILERIIPLPKKKKS